MILLETRILGVNEFGEEISPTVYKNNKKLLELAKDNCRRCHGRGRLEFDFPRRWTKSEVCSCVENRLVRIENKKRAGKMKPDEETAFLAGYNKS